MDGRPALTAAAGKYYLTIDEWKNTVAQTSGTTVDGCFSTGPTASYAGDYAVSIYKTFKAPI